MSLIKFYRLEGFDHRGRNPLGILAQDDDFWEKEHDFIQWIFPLPEPSKMHPEAPVAEPTVFASFGTDPMIQGRLIAAVGRFIQFLEACPDWKRETSNHNRARITRALRCLTLCGMDDVASYLFNYAMAATRPVSRTSEWYWTEARKRKPAWLAGGTAEE